MTKVTSLSLLLSGLLLVACQGPVNFFDGKNDSVSSRILDFQFSDFANIAYMGGEVLYVPQNPQSGQLQRNVKIAVRIGHLNRVSVDETQCYFSDIADEVVWSSLTITGVDTKGLDLSFDNYDAKGNFLSRQNAHLALGGQLDLNGDAVADIEYVPSLTTRVGYENAVSLRFLSSKQTLSTTMYALLPKQYANSDYPEGILGINPEGRFLLKPSSTSGTARAVVSRTAAVGDYVLDASNGSYHEVKSVTSDAHSSRSVADLDTTAQFDEAKFLEVFPLVALNIGGEAVPTAGAESTARTARAVDTVFDQPRYQTFKAKSDKLKSDFKANHFVLPVSFTSDDKHFPDSIKKVIPANLNLKLEQFSVNLGVGGTFVGVWGHLEAGIEVAALVDINNITWDVGVDTSFDLLGPRAPATTPVFTFGAVYLDVGGYFQPGLKLKLGATASAPNRAVECVTFVLGAGAKAWIDYGVDWKKVWFVSIPQPYARPGATAWTVKDFASYADTSQKTPSSFTARADLIPYLDFGLTTSLSGILRGDIGVSHSFDAWLTLGNSNYTGIDYHYSYFANASLGVDVPFIGRVGVSKRWDFDQANATLWSMKLF